MAEEYVSPDGGVIYTRGDAKRAKASLKADRKAFKAEQKNLKKEQKKRAKELDDRAAELSGEDSGGIGAFLITVLIIIMWLAIMGLLVKLDVGGFGSTVLAPILRDVPYLNKILPEDALVESPGFSATPAGEGEEGEEGDTTLVATGNPSDEYLKQLEGELAGAQQQNNASAEEIARLQAEVARLEPFEAQQQDLMAAREQFYQEVLYADNAPDTSNYAEYYEMIDPERAAEIYAEVLQEQEDMAEVQKYAATYSSMKPKKAAAIMEAEAMDINLAARILNQMSSDDRGAILAAITDKDYAAQITKLLKPDALPYINGQAISTDNTSGTWSNAGSTSININPNPSAQATTGASAGATTGATSGASTGASTGASAGASTGASTGATTGATAGASTGASTGAASDQTNNAAAFQSGRWSNAD